MPKAGSVWHLSAEEAALAKKPYYNGYACGHGAHGDAKYDRTKAKRIWKNEMQREGTPRGSFLSLCRHWLQFGLRDIAEKKFEPALGKAGCFGVAVNRPVVRLESCAFCLMLASRSAVCRIRETDGEFRRLHRSCDCKVVPSFSGDPMGVFVEERDPKELYERYAELRKKGKLPSKGLGEKASSSVLGWYAGGFESCGDFASFVTSAESADDLKRRVEVAERKWGRRS
ncbi:MAG: hypothetical protein Q4B69_08005 [Slackia sp.]|nr:hypothetical protein [Slackia sp.]